MFWKFFPEIKYLKVKSFIDNIYTNLLSTKKNTDFESVFFFVEV
jgi:hypothetical protein